MTTGINWENKKWEINTEIIGEKNIGKKEIQNKQEINNEINGEK